MRLARSYWSRYKKVCPRSNPWAPEAAAWQTKWWTAFLRMTHNVEKLHAEPKKYIQVQFAEARKTSMPSPLAASNGAQKYSTWLSEEAKLKSFCDQIGASPKEILTQECVEFSRAFLIGNGVWDEISEFWERARSLNFGGG